MATDYDTTYFDVDPNAPGSVAGMIQARLSQLGQEGWQLSWVSQVGTAGLLVISQRPTPVTQPKGSLGGYS